MTRMVQQNGQHVTCPFRDKVCIHDCALMCHVANANPELEYRFVCAEAVRGIDIDRFTPNLLARANEEGL